MVAASREPDDRDQAPVTCPGCGGALDLVDDGTYACRIGHTCTLEQLPALQDAQVRQAMLAALRALRDTAATKRRLAERFDETTYTARRAAQLAVQHDRHADALERLIGEVQTTAEGPD